MGTDADGIKHTTLKLNGINLHFAEKGHGPAILFIHGFPELWYSWRHQILALSALGYRCVAPDMRGYGDSDAPTEASKYTYFHLVGDLIALIDALGEDKVFVVGHDWGAMVAWFMCLLRPDRVRALVNMSVAFGAFGEWSAERSPVDDLLGFYGHEYYMCRFQLPKHSTISNKLLTNTAMSSNTNQLYYSTEAELEEAGNTEKFLAKCFENRTRGPLFFPKGHWHNDTSLHRPTWMSQEEFNYYVTKFRQTGFTGGLNYYRVITLNWELIGAFKRAKVMVPTKFVVGELDLALHMPGVEDYVVNGDMHKEVPLLKEVVVLKDVGHFLQQEKPDEINEHIYNFIKDF